MNVTVVVDMLAGVLWLLFLGAVVLAVTRAARAKPVKGIGVVILVLGIAGVIVSTISAGLVFIQPEERGVVISAAADQGYRDQALQPGLNWIIPFFESVRTYSISKQTYTMSVVQLEGDINGDDSITARTADGQEIYVDASVIFSVDPAQVIGIHINWQDRYLDNLVRPLSRGVVRDVISQYKVEEVVTSKRDEITTEITKEMSEKMTKNGLLLSDFVLRNITFSQEYAASVEQKQIAEQQAQQARLVVEQRRQEAEQARQKAQGEADAAVIGSRGAAEARLIQAEAEAKALQMISDVIRQNPDIIQYLFVNRIAPGVQTIFLPNNGQYLLPLPTTSASGANELPAVPGLDSIFPAPTPTPTPLPTPTP